jgi:anti-sigma factor RsiW
MSTPEEVPHGLAPLLSALLEGQLTEIQQAELASLLRENPEARRYYLGYLETHALLRTELGIAPQELPPQEMAELCEAALANRPQSEDLSDGLPSNSPLRRAASPGRRTVGLRWAGALLAVVALGILVTVVWQAHRVPPPAASAVARITDLDEVQWPEGVPPLEAGSPLTPGPLRLRSGTAQLTFAQGAVVTVTGPAELELITPQRAFLRYGKMVSYVPEQARGFTVLAPHGQVVDLGTEFAVQVEPSGQTDVHVLTGEVQVAPSTGTAGGDQSLTAGYAARLEASAQGVRSRITQEPLMLDRFDTADTRDLNDRLPQRQQGRLAPVRYLALDSDAVPAIQQRRLAIPFEGRKGRFDPVARVVVDHDFTELIGRRYTIAFKAYLPEMGSVGASHWLAFVLEDGQDRRAKPAMSLAYESKTNFGLMLSPDWLVGLRVAARTIPPKHVFPRNELGGPYQVMIRIDETHADGPQLDAEVNGIPVITGLRVPLGVGRHLGFHTWVKEHSNARGWGTIDDLCVSVDPEPEKTSIRTRP